ncbi:MAG TPA: GNAT family N-acetyltransferase [Jiangellales bacterium]|nr:GNAT family N-acetyltransferase [Jiangellales bacterium]
MRDPVRMAEPADRAAIEEIVEAAYQPWVRTIGVRPAPLDADYGVLISRGQVFVSGVGEPTGVIVLVPEPDVLLIENVAVRPDRQGEGIGRALLAFAETQARGSGRSAVRLYTHSAMTSNVALYERLGYVVTHREPLDIGHLVHLRKDVDGG